MLNYCYNFIIKSFFFYCFLFAKLNLEKILCYYMLNAYFIRIAKKFYTYWKILLWCLKMSKSKRDKKWHEMFCSRAIFYFNLSTRNLCTLLTLFCRTLPPIVTNKGIYFALKKNLCIYVVYFETRVHRNAGSLVQRQPCKLWKTAISYHLSSLFISVFLFLGWIIWEHSVLFHWNEFTILHFWTFDFSFNTWEEVFSLLLSTCILWKRRNKFQAYINVHDDANEILKNRCVAVESVVDIRWKAQSANVLQRVQQTNSFSIFARCKKKTCISITKKNKHQKNQTGN